MNHLTLLKQGIESWNRWRASYPNEQCSLEGHNLSHGYFFEGNFRGVNLRGTNLQRACLVGADFRDADLTDADLSNAYLSDTSFAGANLKNANLTKAVLDRADLRTANLVGTQLLEADLRTTQLPEPVTSPTLEQVAARLFQSKIEQPAPSETQLPGNSITALSVTEKAVSPPSQLFFPKRIVRRLHTLMHESPESFADRQQSIRLSAMPMRQKKLSVPVDGSLNGHTSITLPSAVNQSPESKLAVGKPIAKSKNPIERKRQTRSIAKSKAGLPAFLRSLTARVALSPRRFYR